jgi:hypothetical protein
MIRHAMAKEIALKTETALERVRQAREWKAAYGLKMLR